MKDRPSRAESQSDAEGLAAQTVKGSAYSIGASAVTIVLGFGRAVLMARLLAPEDFGIVAFAMTFLNFTAPFRAFGLDEALIHRRLHDESALDEALAAHFSLRLLMTGLFLLLLLIAIPVLRYVWPRETLLVPILVALTIGKLVVAVGATPTAYLRKEMRFRELAVLQVLTSLTMTLVGPLMAWQGWGVWAIVGEQISGVIASTLVVWLVMRPWSPHLSLDRAMFRRYLSYGKFVFTTKTLDRVIGEFDDLWVGAVLGSQSLGYYSKAYEFANYPRRVVSEPLTEVLFPAFARAQDDRLRLSKAFFRASSLIVRAGFLVGGILVLAARELTVVFLGPKWMPMVPTFQLMLVYVLLEPLRVVSGHLVNAAGRPQFYTRARVVESLTCVPLVILGAGYLGIRGVAVAVDVVLLIGLSVMLWQIRDLVQISLSRMLLYPTIAAGAGLALGWQVSRLIPGGALVQLVLKALVFGTTCSLVLLLAEGREYLTYLQLFLKLLGKPFTRSGVAGGPGLDAEP